jgi:hypothetical protein
LKKIRSESQKNNVAKQDLGIDGMEEETEVVQEQDGISRTNSADGTRTCRNAYSLTEMVMILIMMVEKLCKNSYKI